MRQVGGTAKRGDCDKKAGINVAAILQKWGSSLEAVPPAALPPTRLVPSTSSLDDRAGSIRHACLMGLEGLVSKHKDRPYRVGRSPHWVKVKNPTSPAMLRAKDGSW